MHLFDIKRSERIAPSTLLLTLRPKQTSDRLRYFPGQYAAIGYKLHGRPSPMRCFSIVSSPNNPDELQFAMRVQGNFTTTLASLPLGSTMFLHGPFGEFGIDETYDRNIILMAGGIGITPFISMLRAATERNLDIPITLLYSCRSEDNIPFYEELRDLEQRNRRLRVIYFITNGETDRLAGAKVLSSQVSEHHLEQLTGGDYNKYTYFICGPKGFTANMRGKLEARQTEPERIVSEEFTPSSQIQNVSTVPRFSLTKWTYAFTALALVAASGFFMILDLARAVPRLASDTTSSTTSNTSSSSTDSSSSNTSAQSQTVEPSNQSYQPPITSVS